MRERRFKAGDTFRLDEVDYRVRQGVKHQDDLRIEWCINGEWRPISLDSVFLIVDMIAENEDVLYPPRNDGRGPLGGEMVIRAVKTARIRGWRKAVAELHEQRARKNDPEAYGQAS